MQLPPYITVEKINRFLILFACVICGFLYLDTYVFPTTKNIEKLEDKRQYSQRRRGSTNDTYVFKTNRGMFDVTGLAFNYAAEGEIILVERSKVSGVVQKVYAIVDGHRHGFKVSFINARTGWIFAPVLAIGLISVVLFYGKFKHPHVRNRVSTLVFLGQ